MFKRLFLILVLTAIVCAGPAEDIIELGDEYIALRSRFYPVWATSMGIHDYDSLLTDYSGDSVFNYRNKILVIKQKLQELDMAKLNIDDSIDCRLLLSNIEYDNFILGKYPYYEHSPALHIEEALNSIYYLLICSSMSFEQKAPYIMARLKAIPRFLHSGFSYFYQPVDIFYDIAIETATEGTIMIDEVTNELLKIYPNRSKAIEQLNVMVKRSFENYVRYCESKKDYASGTYAIGKDDLNFLLRKVHFIDIDSDSLKKIGLHWYNVANSAMDSLQRILDSKPEEKIKGQAPADFSKEDIMEYYQREINETADFFRNKGIVTIPEDIGSCIPVEMPQFMRATHRGIAYQPPAPFDADQTGYFYVRPILPLDSVLRDEYYNYIRNRGFKGSVVHEAYPGHHLQLSLANRHTSRIRRLQQDMIMAEGWALYCEQMATEQGLFEEDELDRRWYAVFGGIRFRAVRIIVDCSLADSTMTPDSALVFMNNMLGENTDYFTAEIRRYCANPTIALSYLTGKLIILDMLDKTRMIEGYSFSLKRFHDRLLAEGTISPNLIAEKLGYKE